jgi:hypothetical protein
MHDSITYILTGLISILFIASIIGFIYWIKDFYKKNYQFLVITFIFLLVIIGMSALTTGMYLSIFGFFD